MTAEERRKRKNAAQRRYELAHPETLKNWRKNNPEKVKEQQKRRWVNYLKPRMETEPEFRAVCGLRKYISASVSGKKSAPTEVLLGCTIDQFLGHLEINFQEGMTWDNYGRGGWHIDHIRPLASFSDLINPGQQREAFNWKNLQPLWEKENIRKRNQWIPAL